MLNQSLIFSDKRRDRVKRHLIFWMIWGSYYILLHIASPMLVPQASNFNNVPFPLTEGFLTLLMQVPVTYLTLYFILPQYTREGKVLKPLVWFIVCWTIHYFIYQFVLANGIPRILEWILPAKYLVQTKRPDDLTYFLGIMGVFLGGFSSTAFVAGSKYIKDWYQKEQRNAQLQKENTDSRLQLLTARIHPEFLFNTLTNIYSKTKTESRRGSKMISELSNMLRYILSEGNKPRVDLQKELRMISDYIQLEKIRYGNRLNLQIALPASTGGMQVAPLVLLPFIENSFKHGASKFLSSPWIRLQVTIDRGDLQMKLENGKTVYPVSVPHRTGTGISNVKRRLQLIYPGQHELVIRDEEEIFTVDLRIKLAGTHLPITDSTSTLTPAYATN